jgi:hypothetical protein
MEFERRADLCSAAILWFVVIGVWTACYRIEGISASWAIAGWLVSFSFLPSFLWSAYLLQRFWAASRLRQNFDKGSEELKRLESCLQAGRPFGLFLRDFSGESLPAESEPWFLVRTLSAGGALPMPPSHDRERLEASVIGSIGVDLEVFSFVNCYDYVSKPSAQRISGGDEWQLAFAKYARVATLIIILIENFGPGLEFEITWLESNHVSAPMLLFASQEEIEVLSISHPKLVSLVKWRVTLSEDGSEPSIPAELRDYLRSLGDCKAHL